MNYDNEFEDFLQESVFNTAIVPKRGNGYATVKEALDLLRFKCEEYDYDLEDVIEYYMCII